MPLQSVDISIKFMAALGSGLMAGVFYAFSTFVMKGLSRIPAEVAVPAMHSINVYAVRSLFLAAFMGTAAFCLWIAGSSFMQWGQSGSGWFLAAAISYLAGNFFVTVFFNVPMNNALASFTVGSPAAAEYWHFYLQRWTFWNHVRTTTALLALGFFIVGFRLSVVVEK